MEALEAVEAHTRQQEAADTAAQRRGDLGGDVAHGHAEGAEVLPGLALAVFTYI